MANASAAERAKYEKAEAERKLKLQGEMEQKAKVDAEMNAKDLAQQKIDREKALELNKQTQAQKDQKELQTKQQEIQKENAAREAHKTMSPQLTDMNQTIKMADTLMHDF